MEKRKNIPSSVTCCASQRYVAVDWRELVGSPEVGLARPGQTAPPRSLSPNRDEDSWWMNLAFSRPPNRPFSQEQDTNNARIFVDFVGFLHNVLLTPSFGSFIIPTNNTFLIKQYTFQQ